jgi:metal-sulfur cluster biosynthetic enzyme
MSSEAREEAVWHAESTHPKVAENLRERLREVVDPELGLNIIELGLVRDVMIEENKAHVNMIMTTPFCPYAPALLEMTRSKAEETLNKPTTIEMGAEMWDPSYMEEGAGAEWGLF